MALKTCECCGQVLPDQWELVAARARLSRKQTELFQVVASGGGRPVRWSQIEDALYGADPNGGPLRLRNTVFVTAANANKRLAEFGYRMSGGGEGKGTGLYLVTL